MLITVTYLIKMKHGSRHFAGKTTVPTRISEQRVDTTTKTPGTLLSSAQPAGMQIRRAGSVQSCCRSGGNGRRTRISRRAKKGKNEARSRRAHLLRRVHRRNCNRF